MFCPLNFVFWPGLISLFRLFAWRFFAVLSFLVASFRYFVFPHGRFFVFSLGVMGGGGVAKRRNNTTQKDATKNTYKNETTHGEKTK